ncbi:hypothetical protein [Arthrobacter sp.]|uniref:hypothetical protein n=1 Tax=Arthrobacter sp. TaxID=1667 RepID=UPI0034E8A15B
MDFSLRDRAVLHTLGNDKELPWIEADFPVAQLEHQLAVVLMGVPDELAFDLDDLDLVVVEPLHHIGRPMLGKQGQPLGHVKRLVVAVAPMGKFATRPPHSERQVAPLDKWARRPQLSDPK